MGGGIRLDRPRRGSGCGIVAGTHDSDGNGLEGLALRQRQAREVTVETGLLALIGDVFHGGLAEVAYQEPHLNAFVFPRKSWNWNAYWG
jgi:hypothetical protein